MFSASWWAEATSETPWGILLLLVATACSTAAVDTTVTTSNATTTTIAPTRTTTSTLVPTTTSTLVPTFEGAIDDVDAVRLAHSWHEGCPIEPTELDLVTVSYLGFDGETHSGLIVVHAEHSRTVMAVFESLFDNRYPIESMIPISDLPEGIEDDDPKYSNTSGFHCRVVAGTDRWSEHAFGMAIDLNPHLNPFVNDDDIWPSASEPYVDRSLGEPGMIAEGDAVTQAFDSIGWDWGGRWQSLKDYQHFSATGR